MKTTEWNLPETELESESENIAAKFNLQESQINALRAKCSAIVILDLTDKSGYNQAKEARATVREWRVGVEKRRKLLKEKILEDGRRLDTVAKYLTAKLEEIEGPLDAQIQRIDDEKERIVEEKRQAQAIKMQARLDALNAIEVQIDYPKLVMMSDEHFAGHLQVKTSEFAEIKAKREAEADELASLKAQEERRLADEAAKAEALRIERENQMAIERAKMDEERRAIESAKAEQARKEAEIKAKQDEFDRKEREAQIRKDAEEQARKDADARAELAKQQAAAKAEEDRIQAERKLAEDKAANEAEQERQAAIAMARPDAEKLTAFAQEIRLIVRPVLKTKKGLKALDEIDKQIAQLVDFVGGLAIGLTK